ncbi:hypothetical protein [Heyndrickxia sporothermodurans]|nr:hypothetical protein [Heyndrickxia sporothermodurans]MBL5772303.1 hypothetical protein [Heyndrickxia sporothermodurans]
MKLGIKIELFTILDEVKKEADSTYNHESLSNYLLFNPLNTLIRVF